MPNVLTSLVGAGRRLLRIANDVDAELMAVMTCVADNGIDGDCESPRQWRAGCFTTSARPGSREVARMGRVGVNNAANFR